MPNTYQINCVNKRNPRIENIMLRSIWTILLIQHGQKKHSVLITQCTNNHLFYSTWKIRANIHFHFGKQFKIASQNENIYWPWLLFSCSWETYILPTVVYFHGECLASMATEINTLAVPGWNVPHPWNWHTHTFQTRADIHHLHHKKAARMLKYYPIPVPVAASISQIWWMKTYGMPSVFMIENGLL